MSALDDALVQAEFGLHPDMDTSEAWAELAALRAVFGRLWRWV